MRVVTILILFLSFSFARGQSPAAISGFVFSASDSLPLQGATVQIRQIKKTAFSNASGKFEIISASTQAVVDISYIGYTGVKVLASQASAPLMIYLSPDAGQLEAVEFSTGLQTIPKERATGSFTQIDRKLFNQQVGSDVISRLAYISNGVLGSSDRSAFGSYTPLTIRGISTLTSTISRPLIILDNFEYKGDIDNINPNDVENITFLKDAAAGSIWGARAANGVIVITTKKGKFNRKVQVEVNANVLVAEKTNLQSQQQIAPSDFIGFERFMFDQGFYDFYFQYPQYGAAPPVANILDRKRSGTISGAEAERQIAALANHNILDDYEKYVYRQRVDQQYSVSLSGGSPVMAWIMSAGIDKKINDLDFRYSRANLRLDNTIKLTQKLQADVSFYYTQSRDKTGRDAIGVVGGTGASFAPYAKIADEAGNPLPAYIRFNEGYIDTLGNGLLQNWLAYPLDDYKHVDKTSRINDLNMVFGLSYSLTKALRAGVTYRYEDQSLEKREQNGVQSYFTRDLINKFSQIDYNTGIVNYIVPKGDILDLSHRRLKAKNLRAQLNYDPVFGKHAINSIAGYEISETESETDGTRIYGFNGDFLNAFFMDFVNLYPTFMSGNLENIPGRIDLGKSNLRFVSVYGNATYNYDHRYSFSVSSRRDASNVFGLNTNDKWKPLWSAGAGWNISKEKFYRISWLPELNFRMTYGFQGNIDEKQVAVTTFQYQSSNNRFLRTPVAQIVNPANPELRWEQVGMFNAGIDFSMLKSRISGSIEYYQKNMTDLYGPRQMDQTAGLGLEIITNAGDMRGRGVDFQVRSVNVDRKFKWISDLIINTYRDKVTRLKPMPVVGSDIVGGGLLGIDGYPAFGYFAYKWAGLDPATGDPQGYLEGKVSKEYSRLYYETPASELTFIGSLQPQTFGSFGNTLSWHNVSLTARLSYKFGSWFRRTSVSYSELVAQNNGHSDYAKRWQKPGDEAKTQVPSFVYPIDERRDQFYQQSEQLATKGDLIRLQYVNAEYNFQPSTERKSAFKSLQVYLVVDNLGLIWKANDNGIDPDNFLPPSRSLAIGVRASL